MMKTCSGILNQKVFIMAKKKDNKSPKVDLEWFRSSEDVRKTLIKGLAEGPSKYAFGEKEVTYSMVDGVAIFEGDIAIGLGGEGVGDAPEGVEFSVAITGQRYRWPNGIVAYTIHSSLPNKTRVTNAIAEIQANTSIQFVKRTNANASDFPNYIEFFSGSGCWSYVGMQGGKQQISLASGCGNGSTIHEILHALGMWHEQSREDRNSFVTVNWENIQEGREHNFNQHIIDGTDIGRYDYGSIMHYGRYAFSKNGLPTIVPNGSNSIGQRNGMSNHDIAGIEELYPGTWLQGEFTIQQKSNNRYLDAYQSSYRDFEVVTRGAQNNNSQRWELTPIGRVYAIRQASSGRFLDAHGTSSKDFSAVTRTAQNNDTQLWVVTHLDEALGRYTIQQLSNGRFLDAHTSSGKDFDVVTRAAQYNDTQNWSLLPLGNNRFHVQQVWNRQFLDAWETSPKDYRAVTRAAQNNATQEWIFVPKGAVYNVQQKSSLRFLDAHEIASRDWRVVTRGPQNNATQRWVIMPYNSTSFTIQQASNGRYLDAHEYSGQDYRCVTRGQQNNNTQRWVIKSI